MRRRSGCVRAKARSNSPGNRCLKKGERERDNYYSSVSVIAPSSAFASYAKKDKLGLILELIGLVSVVRRQRFVMGRPAPSSRSKRDIAVYHPPFS